MITKAFGQARTIPEASWLGFNPSSSRPARYSGIDGPALWRNTGSEKAFMGSEMDDAGDFPCVVSTKRPVLLVNAQSAQVPDQCFDLACGESQCSSGSMDSYRTNCVVKTGLDVLYVSIIVTSDTFVAHETIEMRHLFPKTRVML